MDRRDRPRGRLHLARDLLFRALRGIARHASGFYTALGIYLIAGAAVAVAGTWAFVELAEHVRAGGTQAFDNAVLAWMGAHQAAWLQASVLEITALGTGAVVIMIAVVSALFLALGQHRWSAFLLVVATVGGLVLNDVLKLAFHRPRPHVFAWGTHVTSSSFPSGHAMGAVIVYSTVAYLAARLEQARWARVLTLVAALVVIALICTSRLYLGVHYPSDVLAGLVIGFAWAGFCISGLEAVRVFGARFRRRALHHERDLLPAERRARGLEP